jgi:hypothetical protein
MQRVLLVALTPDALLAAGAWRLLQSGAADVLAWTGGRMAEDVAARFVRWLDIDRILESPVVRDNLVGRRPAWIFALRRLVNVARYSVRFFRRAPPSPVGVALRSNRGALPHVQDMQSSYDDGDFVVPSRGLSVPRVPEIE